MLAGSMLAAIILSSCTGKQEVQQSQTPAATSGTEASAVPTEKGEPVTLTITTSVSDQIPLDESNNAIKYIQDHTNTKLKFNVLPSTDPDAKFNLLLASGDYGDVVAKEVQRAQVMQLGMVDKIFIPLNDYIKNNSVYLKKLMVENPQYEQLAYAKDGNIYGFIKIDEAYHTQAYPKLWINQNWLKTLNISEPQTTEEFYNMLVAFRDRDPNGNNKKDEVPLTGSIDWSCPTASYLMNSFIPFDLQGVEAGAASMSYAKDGKVIFSADKEAFREGLRYIKKLVDEKLLDVASFTQKSDQMQQVVRQEPSPVGAYTADHFAMGIDLNNKEMNKAIVALPPVAGPEGVRLQPKIDFRDRTGNFTYFITDKCKNPEAAFMLGDFMLDKECEMTRRHGPEGSGWGKLEKPLPSALGLEALYWINSDYGAAGGAKEKDTLWIPPFDDSYASRQLSDPVPEDLYIPESYEARLTIETQKVIKYFYPEYLPKNIEIYMEKLDEISYFTEIRLNLQNFVRTSIAQFATGEKSLDKDWDSYTNQLKQYQLEEYLTIYQKYFDQFKKLGE